jgi:hypothetical protein
MDAWPQSIEKGSSSQTHWLGSRWKGCRKELPKGAVFYRFPTGTETLLPQADAAGVPAGGGIPVDLQNMVKSLLMGLECLVAWGGVIRCPRMAPEQVVLGNDDGS